MNTPTILSTFSLRLVFSRICASSLFYLFIYLEELMIRNLFNIKKSLLLYIIPLFIQSFIPPQFNFTLLIIITYIQFNSDVACLVCAPGPAVDCISHLCYKKNWIFQAEEFTI